MGVELVRWSESVDGLVPKLWGWCRIAVPVLYGESCCSQVFQWLPMTQRMCNVGDKNRTDRLSRGERVDSGGLEVRMVKERVVLQSGLPVLIAEPSALRKRTFNYSCRS